MKLTFSITLPLMVAVLLCPLISGLGSAQGGKVVNAAKDVATEAKAYATGMQAYAYGFPWSSWT
jgi:hypothetical protein